MRRSQVRVPSQAPNTHSFEEWVFFLVSVFGSGCLAPSWYKTLCVFFLSAKSSRFSQSSVTDTPPGSRLNTPASQAPNTHSFEEWVFFFYTPLRPAASIDQTKEKNKRYLTGTLGEALPQGYSPCGNCNPQSKLYSSGCKNLGSIFSQSAENDLLILIYPRKYGIIT